MWAFIAIMPVIGLSLATGLVLGNVWIKPERLRQRQRQQQVETRSDGADESGDSEVIYAPYLWALLTGNVTTHKHTNKPKPRHEEETELHPLPSEPSIA